MRIGEATVLRRITPVSFLLLPLAACGQATGTGTPATAAPATAAPVSTMSAVPPPGSTPEPRPSPTTAADRLTGTQHAYLRSADTAKRTITFDLIEWYEGKAAVAACKADGEAPAANDWCTGWYIRNNNKKLRTYPVAAGATLRALGGATGTDLVAVDLETFRRTVLRTGPVFTFTVTAGQITTAAEVYTP
jgi:hypothetical protein